MDTLVIFEIDNKNYIGKINSNKIIILNDINKKIIPNDINKRIINVRQINMNNYIDKHMCDIINKVKHSYFDFTQKIDY